MNVSIICTNIWIDAISSSLHLTLEFASEVGLLRLCVDLRTGDKFECS